jgi:hypothetical protein
MTAAYRFAFLVALASSAACKVHGDKMPPLAGPSEFATSITVTATPDSIPQDGASQASIAVTARDPNGKGIAALSLRLGMAVNGSVQDYGILSARTILTASDGRATAIYTAPPPPPSLAGGTGNFVTISVTPIGSNYQTANSISAELRLVPPGVVLPAAGTPTPKFTLPTPVLAGVPTTFDASSSCATEAACGSTAGIVSFAWNFGDGTFGTGQSTTHTFAATGTYPVRLTVTNDRTVSASASQTVVVTATESPKALFRFSPTEPTPGTDVTFNASASTAAPGRTLVQFVWDFGDGVHEVSGAVTHHLYPNAGTYTVVLTVFDDIGQKHTLDTTTVPVKVPTVPTK